MREIILNNSVLLKDDDWVQLRKMVAPEKNINGYTYSHEVRCSGTIVSFLPYRKVGNDFQFLLRKEAVPCWELDLPLLSSFTGGVDKGMDSVDTALKELSEEAGYIIGDDESHRMKYLGTTYSTKSSDSIYHLFAFDLTGKEQDKELDVETELEKSSTNEWVEASIVQECKDPFVGMLVLRLLASLEK
jgi:8-oxo-dGTP pyrophosphatase MutT (NUDIX family)